MRRGFAAMVGANGVFGLLLITFAAGTAFLSPNLTILRILRVMGGVFLLFLAIDAILASVRASNESGLTNTTGIPLVRGAFAVLLNPGAWVFLATTASALFASAARSGGRPLAVVLAVVMLCGIACVDGPMVLLGGGVRRFEERLAQGLVPVLATGLGAFGALLVFQGVRG